MNKSIIAALLISAVGFSSCGGSDAPVKDTSIMPAKDSLSPVSPAITTMPSNGSAVDLAPSNNGVKPVPVNQTPAITASAGLNPEHGLPGHRCDISVGAPLNSPPGNTAAPSVQTTAPVTAPVTAPLMTPAPTNTPTSGSTAKLNPAHGQPGHDCAIAVGAPLKN
jgi:hypothetical protein